MINYAGTDRRCRDVLLIRCLAIVVLGIGMLAGCTSAGNAPAPSSPPSTVPNTQGTAASADSAQAAAVDRVVQEAIKARHLRSVLVRVTVDGRQILTKAYGESMTGVPATVDMQDAGREQLGDASTGPAAAAARTH